MQNHILWKIEQASIEFYRIRTSVWIEGADHRAYDHKSRNDEANTCNSHQGNKNLRNRYQVESYLGRRLHWGPGRCEHHRSEPQEGTREDYAGRYTEEVNDYMCKDGTRLFRCHEFKQSMGKKERWMHSQKSRGGTGRFLPAQIRLRTARKSWRETDFTTLGKA